MRWVLWRARVSFGAMCYVSPDESMIRPGAASTQPRGSQAICVTNISADLMYDSFSASDTHSYLSVHSSLCKLNCQWCLNWLGLLFCQVLFFHCDKNTAKGSTVWSKMFLWCNPALKVELSAALSHGAWTVRNGLLTFHCSLTNRNWLF